MRPTEKPTVSPAGGALPPRVAAALVFYASGAVLVIEVVGLRLVAPYVGVTLQTSSAVIGLSLAAIAVGAWSGGRLADQVPPRRLLPLTLVLAGLVIGLTLPLVRLAGPILAGSDAFSVSLLAFMAVFAPCVFLSGVAPMVVKLQLRDLDRTGTIVGRLSGIGTLGAIVATFATGFVLLAALPTPAIFVALGACSVLFGLLLGLTPGGWRPPSATLALVGAFSVLMPPLAPTPCGAETTYHCARVLADPGRAGGRLLVLDTLAHSYVDLEDPTYLRFAYVQAIASAADVMLPAGQPLRALHLGGGGLTLPRYLAATRPGSVSRVLEIDSGVVALDRGQLGLDRVPGVEVDVLDARVGLRREPAHGRDLVVGDAFGGLAVPWQLTTREVVAEIARVLRPGGLYAVNVIDNPPDRFVRAEVATIAAVFPQVALVAAPGAILGTQGGNFVVLASSSALPVTGVRKRLAERRGALSLVDGSRVAEFGAGAAVLTDDYAPVDQLITQTRR